MPEWLKGTASKVVVGVSSPGVRIPLSPHGFSLDFSLKGEMSERLKEHAWKACVAQVTGGSNPPLSEDGFV